MATFLAASGGWGVETFGKPLRFPPFESTSVFWSFRWQWCWSYVGAKRRPPSCLFACLCVCLFVCLFACVLVWLLLFFVSVLCWVVLGCVGLFWVVCLIVCLFVCVVSRHACLVCVCVCVDLAVRVFCRSEANVELPVVLVSAAHKIDFAMPIAWIDDPPDEGAFTYEADRGTVSFVMKTILRTKIRNSKADKKWEVYRYFIARCLIWTWPAARAFSFPHPFPGSYIKRN